MTFYWQYYSFKAVRDSFPRYLSNRGMKTLNFIEIRNFKTCGNFETKDILLKEFVSLV